MINAFLGYTICVTSNVDFFSVVTLDSNQRGS